MLDFLGEKCAAERIEAAVAAQLTAGRIQSVEPKSGFSTAQFGDLLAHEVGQ
jgi:isocitrate/isopropylmalate dehydrogenase